MRVLLFFTLFALLAPALARAGVESRADLATAPAPSGPGGGPPGSAVPAAPNPEAAGPAAGTPTVKNAGAAKRFPKLSQPSLSHTYQLGLAVLPGLGFRVIAPYGENVDCGQQAKRVCTGGLPFFLDVQPSFGFAEHWDVLVDLRFGILTDFNRTHQFAAAPGLRYWVDPQLPFKFFATIQAVFDATAQNNAALRSVDFGVRNANGLMFEVMRNLGFYLQFGETIGFARWLRFEIDGGIGVQARMP